MPEHNLYRMEMFILQDDAPTVLAQALQSPEEGGLHSPQPWR
jgi:hypothetical protein